MIDFINKALVGGLYYPAYFKISIHQDSDLLELENENNIAQVLFLHEYCHFIQDLTTIYGLNNLARVSELNQFYINHWKNHGLKSIPKLPEDVKNNILISEHLNGDNFVIHEDFIIAQIVKVNVDLNPKQSYILSKIIITTTENKKINFGAFAIMEGMAYIFEKRIGILKLDKPVTYPYLILHKIWAYYFRDSECDEIILFILCDLALNHSEPSNNFIKNLELLKVSDLDFKDYDNIYNLLNEEDSFYYGNQQLKRYELLEQLSNLSSIYLRGYFNKNPEIINNTHQLFRHQLSVSLGYRKEYPNFLIKILLSGGFKSNKELKKFIDLIGSPFITNNNGEAICLIPLNYNRNNIEFEYMWAVRSLFKILTKNVDYCELIPFCKKTDEKTNTSFFHHNCLENPLEKLKCADKLLCPIQKVAKLLELPNA